MIVVAVHRDDRHRFSKPSVAAIQVRAGRGVEGDAHFGTTTQHRSRAARDPGAPNLRQVHLLQGELLDELAADGVMVAPGELGENVTTRGIDLLALPTGTRLQLGTDAVVELTGLRNPCVQIKRFEAGVMTFVLQRSGDGSVARRAGVMAIVLADGEVRPGDDVVAQLPVGEQRPLEPV